MQILRTGVLYLAAILAAAFLAATPGAAQSGTPAPAMSWTGCQLVGAVGGTFAKTELGLLGTSVDGLGQQGMAARAGASCQVQLRDSPIVLGVGGDYTWQNPEFNLAGFTFGLDDSWTLYGTLGIAMGNVKPYVLAGYTQTDWSNNFNFPTSKLKGWTIGAGLDWRISPQFSIGPEYRFTRYNSDDLVPGLLTADTDQHSVMLVGRFNLTEMFK